MAQKIKSMDELVLKLKVATAGMEVNLHQAIAVGTNEVHKKAINKFGRYQPAFGNYPAWAKLAEVTIARKARAGGGEDPLIGHYTGNKIGRKGGDLRKSILQEVQGLTGVVGTNDQLAKYHEYGTKRIPPRPFLRPALFEEKDFIKEQVKKAIAKTLLGM